MFSMCRMFEAASICFTPHAVVNIAPTSPLPRKTFSSVMRFSFAKGFGEWCAAITDRAPEPKSEKMSFARPRAISVALFSSPSAKRTLGYEINHAETVLFHWKQVPEPPALAGKQRLGNRAQDEGFSVAAESADHRCPIVLQESTDSKTEWRAVLEIRITMKHF